MQSQNYDIIIFGSGVVGLTAAACLMQKNIKIALIDKDSHENIKNKSDQRAFALAHGSKLYLNHKNLWKIYDHNSCPIEKIHVLDGYSQDYLEFNQKDIGSPLGLMLSASLIREKLYQYLVKYAKNLDFYSEFDCTEIKYNQDNVEIIAAQAKLTAKLLIAVDGRNSKIRNNIPLTTYSHDYKQVAFAATLKHSNHHQNIAVERFLPNGPFAMLPLKTGYETSIVWTETNSEAQKLLALNNAALTEILTRKTQNYLSQPQICGQLQSFPLNLVYTPQNTYHRTILIGDAAHGMHPLAGQGFNLALRDIKTIDEIIAKNQINLISDYGKAEIIREFYQKRKFDIYSLVSATHALNFIFSNNHPILRPGRKIALKLANKLPQIKFLMLRKAAGL